MDYLNLTGLVASMQTPKQYFDTIIGYIPDTLDKISYWLNQPVVEKFARITLIAWFIFSLLKRD